MIENTTRDDCGNQIVWVRKSDAQALVATLKAEVEGLKEFIRTAGEGSGGACKLDHWAEYQAHTELGTQTTPKEIKA